MTASQSLRQSPRASTDSTTGPRHPHPTVSPRSSVDSGTRPTVDDHKDMAASFVPVTPVHRPFAPTHDAFSTNTAMKDAWLYGPASYGPRPPAVRVLIRRLPLKTSQESLRAMFLWSEELIGLEILPEGRSEDVGFVSALLRFKTMDEALQTQRLLEGRPNISQDAKMTVEILDKVDTPAARQLPRWSVPTEARISPTSPNAFPAQAHELPSPESLRYSNLFSAQSPIGNHLTDSNRNTGKSLINNALGDDEDTSEMLKDPVAFAEKTPRDPVAFADKPPRRGTVPQIPHLNRNGTSSLHVNTNNAPLPNSLPAYMNSMSAQSRMNGHGHGHAYGHGHGHGHGHGYGRGHGHGHHGYPTGGQQPYGRAHYPPVNPADQNPPCNTLYVGNLPADTSEEELKATFSKVRGYKRLCFRAKYNGPMCFVEFEDVSCATRALNELYGYALHNSVKGGIRLSFSKNPLGVRSGQTPASTPSNITAGMSNLTIGPQNGFTTANGPPPGLAAPPGLGSSSRAGYHSFNGGYHGNGHQWSPGSSSPPGSMSQQSTYGVPPHMIGR